MNNLKFYASNAMWGGIILGASFLFTPAIIDSQVDLGTGLIGLLCVTVALGVFGTIIGVGIGLYAGFPPAVTSVATGVCCAVAALGAVGTAQLVANRVFEVSGWLLIVSFVAGNVMVLARLFAPLRPLRR